MADITLHNLNPSTAQRLIRLAAKNGCTVEYEATKILNDALGDQTEVTDQNLYTKIRTVVEPIGGIELELPPRTGVREPPTFDWDPELDNS